MSIKLEQAADTDDGSCGLVDSAWYLVCATSGVGRRLHAIPWRGTTAGFHWKLNAALAHADVQYGLIQAMNRLQ